MRAVFKEIGIKTSETGHNHCTPLEVINHNIYLSFTIIRHPLGWYESYYRYRMSTGWRKDHFIDQHCTSGTFEEFVNGMLRAYPCGFVTARYLSVIPFVNYFLKTEKLEESLSSLFAEWGYKFPNHIPPANVTPKSIDTSISPELKERLLRAEGRIIRHLGYK